MAIGINWAEVWKPVWGPVWTNTAPVLVTVPNVVGETQAAGTADLQALLFVVAVATAYSSVVAAGTIISQSPAGGVDAVEGSTVTITVSLGEAPVTQSNASGGFFFDFEAQRARRRRKQRELEEREEEARRLKDETDREIERLLREQEAQEAEKADLARIQAMADSYSGHGAKLGLPRRVSAAVLKAHEERTRNALEQMRREIERMLDEEELVMVAMMLMDDDD